MALRPRHLRRYSKIAEVMARHGFSAIVSQLGLDRTLSLPRRLWRRDPEPVTPRSAALHLRQALEELGPTFIKLGQIASTRPEILPPAFLEELSNLHDNVPPEPWEVVQGAIERELGAPIEQIFLAFDPTPIAAASLAQVYAALLPDRTQVVVKVLRPGVERLVETDLAIIKDLAHLAQDRLPWSRPYDPVGLADEFSAALLSELDYGREGRNADRFRENFAKEPQLYVPTVYWEFSSRRVLVQERIQGIKLNDIEALEEAGYDRYEIADIAARLVIKEVLEDGFFHADPHPGNLLVLPGTILGLMDFGTVGHLDASDRANLIRLYIAIIQFNSEEVTEQLIRIGIAAPNVDQHGLRRDLRRLLSKYKGMPLKDISASELLAEIQPLIFEYHLRIPSDYWLLLKMLVIMEGVGKTLAPEFDVFAVSAPYVSRFLLKLALPTSWFPSVVRGAAGWADLLNNLPRQTTRILTQVEQGDLGLQVRLPEIRETTKQFNQMANRVVLAILVGALSITLALLIPSLNLTWPWSLPTWAIVVAFVLMLVLALWLIWSLLRSNRRP